MSSNACHKCRPARTWFLFNTWFSVLVIGVSAGATLHVPISLGAWPILIFCFGLVIVLAIRFGSAGRTVVLSWQLIVPSALIVGTVFVVLWGSLIKGQFVSGYPDSWAYTAFATYVQNPAPAIGAGLQPVVSFGRHLMGTRYGTAGLLAFFAQISGTDPCRAAGIFAFFVLVQTGLGFTLLARILNAGRFLSLCAGIFAVSLGWAPEILKVGNWDQILFLSFIPFILLRFRFSTFPTSRRPGILAMGLCLGAATFSYPEGVAMAGVIYLPLLIWRLLRASDRRGNIRRVVVAACVALGVSSVYLPTFASFLYHQISLGSELVPGKGTFGGLLSARWLPAAYGLGGQPPLPDLNKLELIVPLLFVGLSFVALRTWWQKKDGILLTVPAFFLLALWQAILLRYDYGFYKVLTMFWPVMVVAIFAGMSRLLAWAPPGFARSVAVGSFCGVVLGAILDERANFRYAPWREEREIRPFAELTRLRDISGDAPIYIVMRSSFNQMWAVFFLQGYELVVPHPLGYLHHASSGLHDVTTEPEKGTFLLTDEKRSGAIWENQIFSLQNHLDPVEMVGIDAPNGVETAQGDSFIWLNNQFADFAIHSDANRRAFLDISQFWPGPSRPGDKQRTLIVEVNGARTELSTLPDLKVPLKLNQGYNMVRLSCKETPTIDKLPKGETRTLLLGIKGFSFATNDEPVELLSVDAPNRVEAVQGESFIWLNNQWTGLTVDSDRDRQGFLTIRECWSGPSRPEETKRTLIVEVNGKKTETPAAPNLKVPLNLRQGSNLVRLSCKETPTVDKLSSGDTRTLLLGIKGFRVTAAE